MALPGDDKQIKKVGAKTAYTEEQVLELSKCFHPTTGPRYFIEKFMYVQHPVRGKERIKLYDFQADLLDVYAKYNKSVCMLSRQTGKCCFSTTLITVKNKTTGIVESLTMTEFQKRIKTTS